MYKITIKDDFFGVTLSGDFINESKEEAIKEAKEFYGLELGSNPEDVNIVNVEKL